MKTARKKEMAELLKQAAVLLKQAASKPQDSTPPAPKYAIDLRAVRELVDNGQQGTR